MAHISENCQRLEKKRTVVTDMEQFVPSEKGRAGVYLFYFPGGRTDYDAKRSKEIYNSISNYCNQLHKDSIVCVLTTPVDAAHMITVLEKYLEFKLWIAIRTLSPLYPHQEGKLSEQHATLLVFTRYHEALRHTKTRIRYSYCLACGKTTKDYGGKKHTYHEDGTLLSDVWRDIECNPLEDIFPITDRLQDLFGLEPYHFLEVIDLQQYAPLLPQPERMRSPAYSMAPGGIDNSVIESQLINDDCLQALKEIPDNSIDFCFADPPYNIQKKYNHWDDDMQSIQYFSWCDQWLTELIRVLKPGRTLAVVNIPLWIVRYYQYLSTHEHVQFQNWIVWDAMSFPVRLIMPAHYAILCISKNEPRPLPGLVETPQRGDEREYLAPLSDSYCIRESCITYRKNISLHDRTDIYDLWYDIHRLKHNSHRVDHPCLLPPLLMRRLYALFTQPGEIILDCFNGVGTSTLVAHQMKRRYIGIEISPEYDHIARQRHEEITNGLDPFRKTDTVPQSKNSRVERLPKQHYIVPKKQLQLDVKRIAQQLGRLPSHSEVKNLSQYPIEYFDNYFTSWGEVCAAARTTGMSELPPDKEIAKKSHAQQVAPNIQLSLFDSIGTSD